MTKRTLRYPALAAVLLSFIFFAPGCACDPWGLERDSDREFPFPGGWGDDTDDISAGDCAACHVGETDAWTNASSHKNLYACTDCHVAVDETPGPGHRASPWCDNCHSEQTHIPVYNTADGFSLITCMTCHDVHGSMNAYLIRKRILAGPEKIAYVDFTSTEGLADNSYAEPGEEAGEGLCEVCHTSTAYYNRWGTGLSHYESRCTDCHDHAQGFPLP